MKYIKPYPIFEEVKSLQPTIHTSEREIIKLCKKYKIKNYKINEDLSIDVNGNVNLSVEVTNILFRVLPLNLNHIYGNFTCENCGLESLIGFPVVDGYISLDFCPINILAETLINRTNKNELIREFNYYQILKDNIFYMERWEIFSYDFDLDFNPEYIKFWFNEMGCYEIA